MAMQLNPVKAAAKKKINVLTFDVNYVVTCVDAGNGL